MISEKQFASGFSAFWSESLPFLSAQLVTEFNRKGVAMPYGWGRSMKPLEAESSPRNNDVVSEAAFGLFVKSAQEGKFIQNLAKAEGIVAEAIEEAVKRVSNFRQDENAPKDESHTLERDVVDIATRLEQYFEYRQLIPGLTIQPRFRGCGILSSCYGDLWSDNCLFEVKAVDRNLRGADIKQVLIYAVLNYLGGNLLIDTVSVINPRQGLEYRFQVENLVNRIAKKTPVELFCEIGDFLSNYESNLQAQ